MREKKLDKKYKIKEKYFYNHNILSQITHRKLLISIIQRGLFQPLIIKIKNLTFIIIQVENLIIEINLNRMKIYQGIKKIL
jgi:hypothetical protein